MPPRPCLDCGTPTSGTRCPRCQATRQQPQDRQRWAAGKNRRYDTAWKRHSQQARAQHVATHGWTCPGWDRPPHPATDLVVDHDAGVMCRTCNAVKANTHDRRPPDAHAQ